MNTTDRPALLLDAGRLRGPLTRWVFLFLLSFFGLAPSGASAADVKISAAFEQAEITQGEEAILFVSVAGTTNARVTIPEVQGLQISYANKRTQVQIVNFNRMDTVTFIYRVNAFNPGAYTIPGISIEAEGVVQKTPELTLTVLKGSSPEPAGSESATTGKEEKIKLDPDQIDQPYFLQMEMKESRLYVGQVASVTCRLFVRMGYEFAPKSMPVLNSEAFTMGNLNPKQYQVGINGVAYHMLIWDTALTAIKTGDFTLELKQAGEVVDRDRILGGGSSFLNQFMARGSVRPVELKSKSFKVSVLPLPKENRPASFTGAIGSFTFVGQPSSTDLAAGEPMEFSVAIEGSGNFDRIEWPGIVENRLWRSYPPTAAFKAIDVAGIEGKKTYKQALIPLSAEIKEIPMQEFSYFDPVIGQYKTLRSDPVAVKVKASAESSSSVPPSISSAATTVPDGIGLLPNRLALGSSSRSLKSWMDQPWFYWALFLPALLVVGALGYRAYPYISDRFGGGEKIRALDRAFASELQAMQSALQQSDPESFARRARRVLQQSLARKWKCPPESVTRHEVRQRQPRGFHELEALFSALDAVDYSGAALSEEEMKKIETGIQTWLRDEGKGGGHV